MFRSLGFTGFRLKPCQFWGSFSIRAFWWSPAAPGSFLLAVVVVVLVLVVLSWSTLSSWCLSLLGIY